MLMSVWSFSPWPMDMLSVTARVHPRGPYRRSKYSVEGGYVGVGVIVEFAEHGSSVAPIATRVIARHILGPDSLLNRGFRLQVPADSAPIPIPLITDSTLMTLPVPRVPEMERGRS